MVGTAATAIDLTFSKEQKVLTCNYFIAAFIILCELFIDIDHPLDCEHSEDKFIALAISIFSCH